MVVVVGMVEVSMVEEALVVGALEGTTSCLVVYTVNFRKLKYAKTQNKLKDLKTKRSIYGA